MKKTIVSVALLISVLGALASRGDFLFDQLTIDDGLSNNSVNSIFRDHLGFIWFATSDGLTRYDGYDFRVYRYDRENHQTLSNNRIHFVYEDSNRNLWVGTSMGLNLFNRELDNFTRFLNDPEDENSLSHNVVRTIYEDTSGNLWFGTLGGGLNRFDQRNRRFVRYNFPDRHVSALLEDSNGDLWVATNDQGITLLDWQKNEFTYYPFPETYTGGLKPNTLKSLFEDKNGNIWVATEGAGLFIFDKDNKEFLHHYYQSSAANSLSSNIISDIMQFDENTIWLATDGGGINIWDEETRRFEVIKSDIVNVKGLSSNAIYGMLRDTDGVIWIGTFGAGVNILNPHRQQFRFYTQRAMDESSLSHKSVLCFYDDSKGNIWVGTDGGGLNHFNPETGTFKSYGHNSSNKYSISSNAVTSIVEDKKGNLWVGTFAGGLNRFDPESGRFYQYKYNPTREGSISSNNVWKLLEDRDGNLWIGTLDGLELFSYEDNSFRKISGIIGDNQENPTRIIALFEDSKGNIWIGSTGVYVLDKSDLSIRQPDLGNSDSLKLFDFDIRDFHEDKDGVIWIASEGGGLIAYDPRNESLKSYTMRNGLPSDAIHQIIQDDNDIFWLSTNRGIARFDKNTETFNNYNIHDGLQSNQFAYSASLLSKSGEIYFGGVNGFNVFHPDRIRKNLSPPKVYITELNLFNKPVEIGAEDSPLNTHIMNTREITLPYQSVFSFRFTAINYISTAKNQYKFKLEGFDDWNDVGTQRMATYTNINPGKYTFKVIASNNDGVWNDEGAEIEINILPPFWRTKFAYALYVIAFFVLFYFIQNYILNRQKYKHDLLIKDLEKAKIEEINQVKLRFFTNIAHEFRTPLTLILGPLDKIMSSQDNIDASLKKQLNIMGRNAGRLLRLINELMEFRKIEMGRMKLKIVKADLIAFLHDVKSVFDEHAAMHDITYRFTSDAEVLETWFDKEKMEKVIYNILSNSFKFTPDCGLIEMHVHNVKRKIAGSKEKQLVDHIEIVISDNGIGISEQDLPRIFDRFYQVKNKNAPRQTIGISGTGVGLALSRELIDFHRGEILTSSKPGEGSVFRVSFPMDKAYFDQSIVVEQTSDDFVYQYSPGLYGIPHAELNATPENTQPDKKTDKPVLLFVDDNLDMRSYIRSAMEDSFSVVDASDGIEGMEKAAELMPDIIVSDVMMPRMDGIQMCKNIKQNVNISHIPVILLTAKISDDHTIEGFDAGADDYIPKPFNPKLLHSRINNILEIRHQLRERFRKEGILEPGEVSVTSADEVFLKNAMEVVERNISNSEFRVSSFVSEMNMSRSVLYRKFEALTGQSVNEFVRKIRLKRAAQLLSLNELTVSEVTYEVGFNDPQYFSKCFSKQYGMTPSDYARKNRKKIIETEQEK